MIYPVVEIFQSIQGEGFHTGRPANFIRLAGCNLSCTWCDTKYSWDSEKTKKMNAREIVDQLNPQIDYVVITGGEPLIHDLTSLVRVLKSFKYTVAIETNGSLPISSELSGVVDWITVSPKEQSGFIVMLNPDELKYIVDDGFSLDVVDKRYCCPIFLNPESARQAMMKKAYDLVIANKGFRLGVQLHKVFDVR